MYWTNANTWPVRTSHKILIEQKTLHSEMVHMSVSFRMSHVFAAHSRGVLRMNKCPIFVGCLSCTDMNPLEN